MRSPQKRERQEGRRCAVAGCNEPAKGHRLCAAHLEQWRLQKEKHPEGNADDLRPDRVSNIEREQWVKCWLIDGRGGPLHGEVCPWAARWHTRLSIPIIDEFLNTSEIERDWLKYRSEILAYCEQKGKKAWAAQYFEVHESWRHVMDDVPEGDSG